MLIDFVTAQPLAQSQSALGLELAYQANEAYDATQVAQAEYRATMANQEDLDLQDYYASLTTAQSEVAAHRSNFRSLAVAAGALIGHTSLGGDALAVANGDKPALYADGSYTVPR